MSTQAQAVELEALLGYDLRWMLDALEACGEVVEAEGLISDRGLPMVSLAPSAAFSGKDLRIYRAHCRELCSRYKARRRLADLDRVTDAELLLGLSQAALVAPLSQTGLACYSRLFGQIFGPEAMPELAEYAVREKWDGQVDEELSRARGKTVVRPRPQTNPETMSKTNP